MNTKEAVERIKGRFDKWTLDDEDMKAIQILISELNESEDERIRKELLKEIEFISPRDGETDGEGLILPSYHARIDRYKSYLEKQKEQKPESCDCSRDEESYTNGIHHVLMNPEAYGLIKQKPAEQLGGTFTSYDIAKTFTEGQNYVIAHPEKFGLCKPAEWSKEDERNLYNTIEAIKYTFDVSEGSGGSRLITWLKSFRKRFNTQPHWKPSELEIQAIKTAIHILTEERNFQQAGKHLKNILAHYESSEPRKDWKPSEEQMKAMEEVRTIFHNHHLWDEINPILYDYEELMRDLKKLM